MPVVMRPEVKVPWRRWQEWERQQSTAIPAERAELFEESRGEFYCMSVLIEVR
jgi:hypothetical protein